MLFGRTTSHFLPGPFPLADPAAVAALPPLPVLAAGRDASTAVVVVEYSSHKPKHISRGLMKNAADDGTQRAVNFSAIISSRLDMRFL